MSVRIFKECKNTIRSFLLILDRDISVKMFRELTGRFVIVGFDQCLFVDVYHRIVHSERNSMRSMVVVSKFDVDLVSMSHRLGNVWVC